MHESTTHPATEWSMLHDKFYRRVPLYEMEWQNIDLDNYEVVGAPFGGPIALVRAENKLQVVRDPSTATPAIMIFTASGQLLSKINLDTVRIVKIGWSSDERLVCLCANGIVRLYNLFGELTQFTLSAEASEEGVIDGRIWGSGLVALLSNYQFVAITRFTDARARRLANPELTSPPFDWVVVPPALSMSRDVELYVAVGQTIFLVNQEEVQDQLLNDGPFSRMVLSPNCKLMALFNKDGKVSVTSADFQRYLSEFQTGSVLPPKQLSWCGVDSVVMATDDELTVIGPFGDCIAYPTTGATHLVTEVDGVRAISSKESYFIDKASEKLFRLGSTEPGALLLDAYDLFKKENPKAQEHIRSLKDDLATAINECIEVAGLEPSPYWRRNLLKAASFGMSFMDAYNADTFVDMCSHLRVLNNINDHQTGIPMTYPHKPEALIQRLVGRQKHLLAVRIAEHLHLPTNDIMVDWACNKIKRLNLEEEAVAHVILSKLSDYPGLSYVEMAKTAYKMGKTKLATMLIDHEPRASDQVPLLLNMNEPQLALVKAIESANTDLIYYVLFMLRHKYPLSDFLLYISDKPVASDLLICYAREQDPQLLESYYFQADQRAERANLHAQEAFRSPDVSEKTAKLQMALKMYNKSRAFDAKQQLQDKHKRPFVGLSVSETMKQCILAGDHSQANRIRADFKVPEKRFWWLKIKALAELRDWDALEQFSKTKKSPIGYLYAEAAKYIERCEASIRPSLYLRIKWFDEAAKHAFAIKDVEALE
ncbi:vacuolar protein sorting protein vps16 [Syncephalis pseudoplumigaleata]|uniref:Probable vacuolar protein sorting-associated protein 16 homolog n=1 Tax=Syncephalis pseudoplumigaleata TaxID=1712513 RepID=A0A4V1J1H3_9FUNG|nr:vacuolar protein sorting protein vps16 [Syncephalis pseudoplumigaleata]|eukprot:RKP25059.1 vacuolar protein sorting protein vps16 [Syncephalis pseudoplumigaleata]